MKWLRVGIYNVNAAVHNVNGGVYKVNEPLLNSLSTRVNKTHATLTNVNAAAPNAGGDVSQTSQVRSTYCASLNCIGVAGLYAIVTCDGVYERLDEASSEQSLALNMCFPSVATEGNDWVPIPHTEGRNAVEHS